MPNTREKEKLEELLRRWLAHLSGVAATDLIAHGVTVQEGKPLEAFLHPIDAYKGLKAKYLVFKADTGEMVDNCFILRPDRDAAAVEALRAYAKATDNEILAEDIYNWVGNGVTVQEWISVKDRLPEELYTDVLVCRKSVFDDSVFVGVEYAGIIDEIPRWSKDFMHPHRRVTHWMPLPEPPKGE